MENEILDGSYEPRQGNKTSQLVGHILKYSAVLFALLLSYWGLIEYAVRYLGPGTTVAIAPVAGFIIIAAIFVILLVSLKRYFKNNTGAGILLLTILGTSIIFVAIASFQLVRLPFIRFAASYVLFMASLYMIFFGMVLSFFIAFQLVTKRTGMLILMVVSFLVLVGLLSDSLIRNIR